MREPVRVYADSSVYGGCFDPEFEKGSFAFFEQVYDGRFALVVSPLVVEELSAAPPSVRDVLDAMLPLGELFLPDANVRALQSAYLAAGVVTPRSADDALHVATATVAGCLIIVSWNFRHIVHFQKIRKNNEVNAARGYGGMGIHAPPEVLGYEEEGV